MYIYAHISGSLWPGHRGLVKVSPSCRFFIICAGHFIICAHLKVPMGCYLIGLSVYAAQVITRPSGPSISEKLFRCELQFSRGLSVRFIVLLCLGDVPGRRTTIKTPVVLSPLVVMGNICSDLGDRTKSASSSFANEQSTLKTPYHQQQYRLIEPIVSSSSAGQTALVKPTDRIIAGSSNDNDNNNNNNIENIHRPVLLTSTPPIPSTFHRLLDYSRRHVVSFVKDSPLVDFAQNDYRAFCLLVHRQHGAIMLQCTRKKKKPPHYQLPGGHVDKFEFDQVRQTSSSSSSSSKVAIEELYQAAKIGCAREVYEETGNKGSFLVWCSSLASCRP